jgi:hypothetical protein
MFSLNVVKFDFFVFLFSLSLQRIQKHPTNNIFSIWKDLGNLLVTAEKGFPASGMPFMWSFSRQQTCGLNQSLVWWNSGIFCFLNQIQLWTEQKKVRQSSMHLFNLPLIFKGLFEYKTPFKVTEVLCFCFGTRDYHLSLFFK